MLSPFQMKLNLALEICQKLRGTTQQNHTNVADCKATPSEPQRTRACTDIACFFPMILIWCRNILMLVRGLRISKQELLQFTMYNLLVWKLRFIEDIELKLIISNKKILVLGTCTVDGQENRCWEINLPVPLFLFPLKHNIQKNKKIITYTATPYFFNFFHPYFF